MKRRIATGIGMAAMSVLLPVFPAAASASTASMMIGQRTCRVETPRQIVLVHSAGSSTCYGGSVGHLSLFGRYVQTVHAGGYTGAIGWQSSGSSGGAIFFSPGDVHVVGRNCSGLNILPGS